MERGNMINQGVAGKRRGIAGSTLKWIAIVTMLIDHVGATVLTKQLFYMSEYAQTHGGITQEFVDRYNLLYDIMSLSRGIGRIAFPIFCFLLVEGFLRTKHLGKYIGRVCLFAILSEIPFDLAFTGKLVYWEYQNVMVTLLIGLLTMCGCQLTEKKVENKAVSWILGIGCVIAGAFVADILHTDYGAKGILPIMLLYVLRSQRIVQLVAGAVSFCWELPAPLAFLFLYWYNGERGMKMKYFFYAFYPVHLLILYLVCLSQGTAGIPVV